MQKRAEKTVHPVIDAIVGINQNETSLKQMESRDVFAKIILKID